MNGRVIYDKDLARYYLRKHAVMDQVNKVARRDSALLNQYVLEISIYIYRWQY